MSISDVLGPGCTALVTGASRGIGALIAGQIAREGSHVVLTGRSAADLEAVTAELAAAGADVSFIPADLTEPGAAQALAETVERQRGGIDLLVNNAGGDPLREFPTMTIEENLRILQLNLIAPVALSHAALDGMLRWGRGHIVNISAMAGRVSFPYTEAYTAAKDGLIGFTRVLRSDYRARGQRFGPHPGRHPRSGPGAADARRVGHEGLRLHGSRRVRGARRGQGGDQGSRGAGDHAGSGPSAAGGHGLLPGPGADPEPGGRGHHDDAEDHRVAGGEV